MDYFSDQPLSPYGGDPSASELITECIRYILHGVKDVTGNGERYTNQVTLAVAVTSFGWLLPRGVSP